MELDVRGEMCPYPAMKAKEALQRLSSNETTLDVLTDHAPALSTVPWEGAKLGFASDVAATAPGEWRIRLAKTAAPIDQKKAAREIAARAAELAGD